MIRKALRRRATAFSISILLGLLFTAGYLGSTYAYFDGETDQTATFAGGYLVAPSALGTPTVQGYGAALAWTPATTLLTAQALYGLDRGTTTTACPAFTDTTATYTALTTNLTTTLATTTDAGNSAYNGDYYCYQIQSTHGSWYQGSIFAALQVGLVPTAVTLANANNTMANSDKITIAYNQPVVFTTPVTVAGCPVSTVSVTTGKTTTSFLPGTAVVGGGCGSTGSIGLIDNLTLTQPTKTFTSSSIAGSGTKTITITLNGGANIGGSAGSETFIPSGSNVKSSVGSATVCNCTTVSAAGGF